MKKCEVLSPAGNMDAMIAAVRSGADAVYLGAASFSARRNAGNFDNDALKTAVEYCHIRGVKVYLALNIMLKNSEIRDAVALAKYANAIGIDGLILQDIGLAYVLKNVIPDMPLHASTQMSVSSPAALSFLKEAGFCRVVLAREMNKAQIKEFCEYAKRLNIEVEMFVHGALCMSVSGQCLLSSMIGERSGNRGLCAGPCRLPFKAEGGTGYDLSLKDLSLFEKTEEICEMGVCSLKIEGRMKRPEYVAAATAACRTAVDGKPIEPWLKASLSGVFSRSGFTSGYFENEIGKQMFGIRTKDDVLSSAEAFSPLHSLYRGERQSVPVTLSAVIKDGKKISFTVFDGKNSVCAYGEMPQKAQKKAADVQSVSEALCKLGGTPYFAQKCDVVLDDGLFVPNSVLNSLRRDAVSLLDEKRAEPKKRRENEFSSIKSPTKRTAAPLLFGRFTSAQTIPENAKKLQGIILPMETDFPSDIPQNVIKITDLPRYIKDETKISKRLSVLKSQGIEYALCGSLAALELALNAGLKIIGNTGLNIANDQSANSLNGLGVYGALLSPELSVGEINGINADFKKGIFAYGRLALMLCVNCPLKNGGGCKNCDKKGYLTDRLGLQFPVRCRENVSEVFNSKPIFIAERLSDFKNIDFAVLSFVDEDKQTASKIIDAYINKIRISGDYTKGLYYRNLL